MKPINQYTYDIKNLSCANCAAKIENKIRNLTEVSEINIDFINNKLNITSSANNRELLRQINHIANKIEPGTKISEVSNNESKNNHKITILRLICGFLLLIIGYLEVFPEILFLVAYIIVGIDVLFKAVRNIIRGSFFDENFLMMIATFAAIYIKSYEEAIAVMLFYETGELLQDLAVDRSRKSIKKLIDITPKYANIKQGETLKQVRPEIVKIDDIIIVKPGEKIPLDGIILGGESSVDTSQLTGEKNPKYVETNDEVLAGYINYNGLLKIKVTKLYVNSAVNKILELVQNAQSKKAKVERFITRFARIYTPIVIFLALLTVLLPMLFVDNYSFNEYLYRGAIFLVVSCPCALVISIPLSMFGGIGAASKQGILIKGGNYLDLINKVGIIVFDKTGTLTKGEFVVTKVVSYMDETEIINKAIIAESLSNHPLAKAIVNYREVNTKNTVTSFSEVFGKGVKAIIDNEEVLVGNSKLLTDNKIDFNEVSEIGTIVYIAINKKYRGYFVINDEVKSEAKKAITDLKKQGISRTIILTGDNDKVSESVRKELGIDEVYANLLPEDKLTILEQLKEKYDNSKIMFVGDGVNDTPVLTQADIGVAMGGLGSDAALEVSDCIIMNDNLHKLVTMRKLSALTKRKIWQNITLALGVKIIVLFLSAFGLTTMWMAVFSDVGVALLAVLNSIMILRFDEKPI